MLPVNILMVGVGGQGIILSSNILVLAGLKAGFDVKKSEIHGMSQRGGSVFSHVRMGDKIYSPVIPKGAAHVLLSLEELETLRWLEFTNPDSKVIFTRHRINPSMVTEYPQGVEDEVRKHLPNIIPVDAAQIREKTGNPKYLNVALLGLLSNYLEIPDEAWQAVINKLVPKGTFEKNMQAFEIGKLIG